MRTDKFGYRKFNGPKIRKETYVKDETNTWNIGIKPQAFENTESEPY